LYEAAALSVCIERQKLFFSFAETSRAAFYLFLGRDYFCVAATSRWRDRQTMTMVNQMREPALCY